jgi:hypothetical protein
MEKKPEMEGAVLFFLGGLCGSILLGGFVFAVDEEAKAP